MSDEINRTRTLEKPVLKLMRPAVLLLAPLVSLGVAGELAAEPITIDFQGEISSVADFTSAAPFAVGDPIRGTLTYDPDGAVDPNLQPTTYSTQLGSVVTDFRIRLGDDYEVTGDPSAAWSVYWADIGGGAYDSMFFRTAATGAAVEGQPPLEMFLSVRDTTKSGSVRLGLPTLEDWEIFQTLVLTQRQSQRVTFTQLGSNYNVYWDLTSVAAVPEPTSAALLMIGLLGLAVGRRRG